MLNYCKNHLPRTHLVLAVGLSLCLIFLSMLPSDDASAIRLTENLPLPTLEPLDEIPKELLELEQHITSENGLSVKTAVVKPGDNLSKVFARVGLSDRDMFELIHANKAAKGLAQLYPGNQFEFSVNSDGKLVSLIHRENELLSQSFTRVEDGFEHQRMEKKPEVHLAVRSGSIRTSLFEAAKDAYMDESLIMELATIFGWDIDFAMDIREHDSFSLIFEEEFLEGKKIGNGAILAAEFTNRKKTYTAVRYVDSKGNAQYYAPNGDTMRKEFLRTPLEFAYISSHFNLRRKHPILNRIRAHKGTDYAAARGTPIKAAGDGKVIYASVKGGYGKTIIIQHGQKYRTLYAHLNGYRKGIRVGKRVKQGQTIGYVGSTGLATGPHLHYEFHVNGVVRNPLTVKLPKAKAIPKTEKDRFLVQTQPLLTQLAQMTKQTKVAATDTPASAGSM